jgi:hypothetical protein
MIQDPNIVRAVSHVLQRSERQEDLQKLLSTFVDVGILPILNNDNHQILYGRRGTGKTHVFKVLGSKLAENPNNTVVYIDARILGSTVQFSDFSVPIKRRCLSLFRDILAPMQDNLMEHICEYPNENCNQAFEAADQLAGVILEPFKLYEEQSMTTSEVAKTHEGSDAKVAIKDAKFPTLEAGISSSLSAEHSVQRTFKVESEDKVVFPNLFDSLSRTLELANTKLYVLIDEWSSLPQDIQPYLAEFLKRGLLPVTRAVLKIASLEYRSRFFIQENGHFCGVELGADIAIVPDLDDYYVYDRNPAGITEMYAEMLLRHLNVDLEENYLARNYRLRNGKDFASRFFTELATFRELARAAEGVVRDLINIFNLAFFNSLRRNRQSIDRKAVLEAARQWFEQDKAQHLDDHMQIVLRHIVDKVIGKHLSRSFLLPRHLEKHPMVQKLFDARVLHPMQRGYADKDNPGVRYNIYTLDYGTYLDLIGTTKQPQLSLITKMDGYISEDYVVPFDDKRSIRRIILGEPDLF